MCVCVYRIYSILTHAQLSCISCMEPNTQPAQKEGFKAGKIQQKKMDAVVDRFYQMESLRELKRLTRECRAREGVNFKSKCFEQIAAYRDASKPFIEQDFDWLNGPFEKASDL